MQDFVHQQNCKQRASAANVERCRSAFSCSALACACVWDVGALRFWGIRALGTGGSRFRFLLTLLQGFRGSGFRAWGYSMGGF